MFGQATHGQNNSKDTGAVNGTLYLQSLCSWCEVGKYELQVDCDALKDVSYRRSQIKSQHWNQN